ncbi:SprT-like domain-containing protein, partial [Akkermansiaceae bacterium]|nr:SprT-like domain-containing protein [Akkermansiaceae bacterium]
MKFSFAEPSADLARGGSESSLPQRGPDETFSHWCRTLARDLDLIDLEKRVVVEWNPRMRSCAGRAFWPIGLIQLNPELSKISNSEIKRTVLHELAHLVAYERNPYRSIKSHGLEWQRACADLGIP